MSTTKRFTVLSREWCHLCHELVDALQPIAAEYGWAGHELSGAGGMDLNRKIIAQQGLGLPRWSN